MNVCEWMAGIWDEAIAKAKCDGEHDLAAAYKPHAQFWRRAAKDYQPLTPIQPPTEVSDARPTESP